jgi:hypothetical protein
MSSQAEKIFETVEDKELTETLCSLSNEERILIRDVLQVEFLLSQNPIPDKSNLDVIHLMTFLHSEKGVFHNAIQAFLYGFIQGKKAERAKRKGACK